MDKNLNAWFVDEEGVKYFVGILRHTHGTYCFTTVEDDGGVKRFRPSRFLPERKSPEEAFEDLASYAKRKGWTQVKL